MKMNQQIIVHSTGEVSEYLGAKADIERLASHLKIESELPSGMTMISAGQNAPNEEYQDSPWLVLSEDGTPIALKFFNGSEWVDIVPYKAVKSTFDSQYILRGMVTFDYVQPNRQQWTSSKSLYDVSGIPSEFKFEKPFKALPSVSIAPRYNAGIYKDGDIGTDKMTDEDLTDDIEGFECVLGEVTLFGFEVWMRSRQAVPLITPTPFTFEYTAIGEMKE